MRAWIKRRWKLLVVGFLCAEAFLMLYGCADELVLRPSQHAIDPRGARAQMLSVAEGKQLEIFIQRSPACGDGEPKAYVLEFCGNGTRAEDITAWLGKDRWGKLPVELWCLNYPGYGKSTGPARLRDIPPAALNTYDALKKVAGDRPIFVTANSLGGISVLHVASQRPVAGVILQNPPPLKDLLLGRFGWWNLWLVAGPAAMQIPPDMNALELAPKVPAEVPALFIQSLGDSLIPPDYQNRILDAYKGPKTVLHIPNMGHNDGVPKEYEQQVREWIQQLWDRTFAAPN